MICAHFACPKSPNQEGGEARPVKKKKTGSKWRRRVAFDFFSFPLLLPLHLVNLTFNHIFHSS